MAVTVLPMFDDSRYSMQILLDQSIYTFLFAYNDRADKWAYSIFDEDNNAIVQGLSLSLFYPLNLGFIDERLPSGRLAVIDPKGEVIAEPNRSAWREDGQNFKLCYITED